MLQATGDDGVEAEDSSHDDVHVVAMQQIADGKRLVFGKTTNTRIPQNHTFGSCYFLSSYFVFLLLFDDVSLPSNP